MTLCLAGSLKCIYGGLNAVRVKVEAENSEGLQITVFDEDVDDPAALDQLKQVVETALSLERAVKRYWEAVEKRRKEG